MHYRRINLALRIGMGIIILVTNKVQNIMTCTLLSPLSVKPDRNCQCSLDTPPPNASGCWPEYWIPLFGQRKNRSNVSPPSFSNLLLCPRYRNILNRHVLSQMNVLCMYISCLALIFFNLEKDSNYKSPIGFHRRGL